MHVDLIWIGSDGAPVPAWNLGALHVAEPPPRAVAEAVARRDPAADAVLFRDAALGAPDEAAVRATLRGPGDVWHAGLSLGMGGLPRMIDFVDPVWRFNRDPEPEIDAISWRLSLGACLVRAAVLDRLGGPDPHFETMAGASLELGHRWIRGGALMRHVAEMIPGAASPLPLPALSLNDETRFLRLRYGRMWTAWACWRRGRRAGGWGEAARAFRRPQAPGVVAATAYLHEPLVADKGANEVAPTVTILIPTLDRYPHLFNLLDQLRKQTVPPLEIVVVDQTERERRDTRWPEEFTDLPLRVLWRDVAGQCSSRNAGLVQARGDTVLFLDDDDEIEPNLIDRHLAFLRRFDADASCGVAHEVGAGPLPAEFSLIRDSDVFPTNNSLLRLESLRRSGLFDLAYEKGERADHDLGMRLYLSGAKLLLNPAAAVVHLRAPRGGLRQHKARVVTRSSSRSSVWQRQFLAPTEAYLWSRYFGAERAYEATLIRTVSTLRGRGGKVRRLMRAIVMSALLPDTWRQNKARLAAGRAMLEDFPAIPDYDPAVAEELLTL